jgi:hypothetical protein
MVYIDTPFDIPRDHPTAPRCFLGHKSAHLMADSEAELVAYARKIGMRESWIQRRGTPMVHFDVTGSRLARVLKDPNVRHLSAQEVLTTIRLHKALEASVEPSCAV